MYSASRRAYNSSRLSPARLSSARWFTSDGQYSREQEGGVGESGGVPSMPPSRGMEPQLPLGLRISISIKHLVYRWLALTMPPEYSDLC
jgi:hypothetical protein